PSSLSLPSLLRPPASLTPARHHTAFLALQLFLLCFSRISRVKMLHLSRRRHDGCAATVAQPAPHKGMGPNDRPSAPTSRREKLPAEPTPLIYQSLPAENCAALVLASRIMFNVVGGTVNRQDDLHDQEAGQYNESNGKLPPRPTPHMSFL